MHVRVSLLALATLALGTASCTVTSNQMSCTLVNAQSKMPERCVEYTDFDTLTSVNAKASLTILCKAFNADIKNKLCDLTGAVKGCQKDSGAWTQTDWAYATMDKPTAASYSCGSNETELGPDRQPLPPGDMSLAPDLSMSADLSSTPDLSKAD